MIVIVEGCDKVGKTTLAQTLAARVGLVYLHVGVSTEDDLFRKYIELIHSVQQPTIADRFYPSEVVYGPLKRGYSRLNALQFQELNRLIQIRGGCFIYCFADPHLIVTRFEEQGEKYLDTSLIPEVLRRYQEIVISLSNVLPTFSYNSGLSQPETSKNMEELITMLVRQKEAMA